MFSKVLIEKLKSDLQQVGNSDTLTRQEAIAEIYQPLIVAASKTGGDAVRVLLASYGLNFDDAEWQALAAKMPRVSQPRTLPPNWGQTNDRQFAAPPIGYK